MDVNAIYAADAYTYGIGKDGGIPWTCPADMKWFK
jgi:dihydrofolate reductase